MEPAPTRLRVVALAMAVLLVATALGCTTTSTPDTARPRPTDTGTGLLSWVSCDRGFECATLTVPLDYGDPTGATIELALTRKPAKVPAERIGSLLLNPGGPGASGITFLQHMPIGGALADRFDLTSWDPRGIGASSPLACGDTIDEQAFRELDSNPDTPQEQQALDRAGQDIADQCARSDLALLEHFDTSTTAQDLDQIRQALGDGELNYLGFSYGTQIGQEYARQFPGTVRAMVLDGVVDPSLSIQDMLRGQTTAIDATFGPATLAALDAVLAEVEITPLLGRDGLELGPGLVTIAAIAASYLPTSDAVLLSALDRAAAGDTTPLEDLAGVYLSGGTSLAAYLGVTCVDSPFEPGPAAWNQFADELAIVSPRFGAAVANELIACAYWPVASQRQPALLTTEGLPPILVIGTTGDAATPLVNAVKVAAALPGAVLLTFESGGHTAFRKSACVDDAIDAYLIDLEVPAPGTVCR